MKKFFTLFLTAILALTVFGCGSGLPPVDVGSYQAETPFRFAAYYTPPHAGTGTTPAYYDNPNYATVENYQIMKDCGFNYAYPIADLNDDHVLEGLRLAEAVGMEYLVMDLNADGLYSIIKSGGTYQSVMAKIQAKEERIKERYDKFAGFKSFAGLFASDEPSTELFPAIAAAQDWFADNYPDYEFYCNLLPNYATQAQLFGSSNSTRKYSEHVHDFVAKTNPSIISYDSYPLMLNYAGNPYVADNYLNNLEVFAEESKLSSVPYYIYIQTTGFPNQQTVENYREIAWQAYASMAYGVSGIQVFTYWTMLQEESVSGVTQAIVDREGNKLPLYGAMQKLIGEIKSFEDIYMNFAWEGTMAVLAEELLNNRLFDLLNNPLTELEGVREVSADQDALIGQFKDRDGHTAYMVTNITAPHLNTSSTVTMKFDGAKRALVCKGGARTEVEIKGNALTLELGSGEGCFVLPL